MLKVMEETAEDLKRCIKVIEELEKKINNAANLQQEKHYLDWKKKFQESIDRTIEKLKLLNNSI